MDDIITKNSLERTIGFISELELNEEDYENIFKKFKPILKNQAIKNKLDILEEVEEDDSPIDLEAMTKKILEKISIQDLKFILEKMIKNEDLTTFIQDLILEKLI
jgi:translation initiation factor 2 beta subunit (eIF-2beta)/eIF-5